MHKRFDKEFKIPPSRIDEFRHEMDKLIRKAHRYGNDDISYTIGELSYRQEKRIDSFGRTYKVDIPYYPVTIEGQAPQVGPYELIARIELGSKGNIVDTVPGAVAPDEQYRFADGYCDHCSTRRRRKLVYIVRHEETGEQLQVGRQCLRDFLGIDTPELIAHRFSFLRLISDPSFEGGFRIGYEQLLINILSVTATCVRLYGWAPSKACATSTSGYVGTFLNPPRKPTKTDKAIIAEIKEAHNDDDEALAERIIHWVRDDLKPTNDYAHNLKVIFQDDVLTDGKRQSLVVSAIAAYNFAMDLEIKRREREREAANSEFQGEIKQRLRGIIAEVTDQRSVGFNDFGSITLIKFKDENGNIYSWFSSTGGTGLASGTKVKLDGTVKKHNEFRGAKETVLTRCRLEAV